MPLPAVSDEKRFFGLQWQDINFEKRSVHIERATVYIAGTGIIIKPTKSNNGNRLISLPQEVLAMLQAYKEEVRAAAKRKAKRQKVVTIDDPCGPDKWIFPQADGSAGHPHGFNSFLRRFCTENNLPVIGPHTFRHIQGPI